MIYCVILTIITFATICVSLIYCKKQSERIDSMKNDVLLYKKFSNELTNINQRISIQNEEYKNSIDSLTSSVEEYKDKFEGAMYLIEEYDTKLKELTSLSTGYAQKYEDLLRYNNILKEDVDYYKLLLTGDVDNWN